MELFLLCVLVLVDVKWRSITEYFLQYFQQTAALLFRLILVSLKSDVLAVLLSGWCGVHACAYLLSCSQGFAAVG